MLSTTSLLPKANQIKPIGTLSMSTKKPSTSAKTASAKSKTKAAPAKSSAKSAGAKSETKSDKIFVIEDITTFDASRLVHDDPKRIEYTIGKKKIGNTMSYGHYLDDEGEKCTLYLAFPEQTTFGVNHSYDLNVKEEDKKPENSKGLQLCYPMTSMNTIEEPTEQEQALMDAIEKIGEIAVEQAKKHSKGKNSTLPTMVSSAIRGVEGDDYSDVIKPAFSYKLDEKKRSDKTKPQRMYIKLVTTGGKTSSGSKPLICHTKFYGPGDVEVSALRYVDRRGIIMPCVKYEGIYWGAHGETPYVGSLHFRVSQANFTPVSGTSSVPARRLLGKNTAVADDDDDDVPKPRRAAGDDDSDNEDFNEDRDPRKTLAKAAGLKGSKKPSKVVSDDEDGDDEGDEGDSDDEKAKTKSKSKSKKAEKPKQKPKAKAKAKVVEDESDDGDEDEDGDDDIEVDVDEDDESTPPPKAKSKGKAKSKN